MKKRALSILLACVFLLSVFMFCTTAFAAENSADGLTAVLDTDKDAYVAGDTIDVTLEVTNTGNLAHNVQTELIIPEGVTLVEGQLKSEAAPLAGNDSVKFGYVLEVPSVEVPTTAAPTTQAPTTQPGGGEDTAPETRDLAAVIYGTLAIASLAGLIALTFGSKMLKQRWFVLILCAGLLLGAVAPMAASAAEAGNSFEVVKAITIDGAEAEVKAIVTYDLVTDEVVYKAEGEVKWSHVGEMGYYTPSNITYQGVSTNEKTRVEIEAPYYAMLFGSAEGKAGKYDPAVMFNADAEQQVLIGRTDDEASLKALELIDTDEWIIALVDGKIVVTGWYDVATAAAVDALAELVNVDAADVTLTLPIVGKMNYTHSNLPTMTAGTFLNGMDSERGAVILRYNDITEADFNAYAEDLVAAGYSLYQDNELTNLGDVKNISATYVNGEDVVTIIYLPYVIEDATDLPTHLADAQKRSFRPDGTEMRIILQSTAQLIPNEEANVYEDLGITPKMHNVNLYNKYGDGNDIGQCTIYTLADGSFLVWDGGYGADAEQLYRALKYMNERPDGKIVVAGWFFTHDHGDHTNAIAALAGTEYASEITIEKVILNHAADVENWYSLNDPLGNMYGFGWAGVYDNIENVIPKFAQGEDYQLIVPHFGQVLNIRNANIEVLFAGEEDAFPVLINNDNACSLVTMVTFDDEEVDDRILLLGDHALDATYNFVFPYLSDGPMHCDIVQTAHHGLGGGTSKLYPICGGPETAIWCTTWRSANGEVTNLAFLFDRSQNKALRDSVKVDVMCDEYVHTLELPFNADEDEVIRTKLGTYKTKFQDGEMDITMLPAYRFQKQWGKAEAQEKIISYLKEYSADLLILPLIDQNSVAYNNADLVKGLEEALDYRYVYYAPVWDTSKDATGNFETGDDTMGHLVLSTYPILKAETGILVEGNTTAWANPEGRGYAHLLLDVEGIEMDVVATHFNDAGNWTKFNEMYEQWGQYTIIAGNTKIKGDGSKAGEGFSAAFAEDITILGSEGISFVDSKTDSRLNTEGDDYFVNVNMSKIYTTKAIFSLYTAPEASDAPVRQAVVSWWAHSWGGSYGNFEIIAQNLKDYNPGLVAFQQISNSTIGITPEQILAETGYEYGHYVEVLTTSAGKTIGHMALSHYPIEVLEDLIISDGSDDQYKEQRAFGHIVVTINGTEIDLWYGGMDGSANQLAKLEAAVNAVASETGRPFIISTNDCNGMVDLTSFAGYGVYSYSTPYMANVLVSTGKVTVTKAEAIKTSISYPTMAGMDDMNLLDLDVEQAPAIGNWWINRWGGGASFDAATEIIREHNLPIITLQQLSNSTIGATAEQVAKETGYEYFYSVEKVHVTDTYEINHMILSHYPIESQEDIVLVDYASGKEGRKFGHVIVDINGTKVDVYFGATDWLSTENLAALEAAVAKVVTETGRPFIVSGNDMANEGVTSFAGVEVYNYRTDYVATVMVSKGALEVAKTETIKTSISAGGIDDLNVVYFNTADGGLQPGDPFVPPVEPEPDPEPEEPAGETVTLKVAQWWCNYVNKAEVRTEVAAYLKSASYDLVGLIHLPSDAFTDIAALAKECGYEYYAYAMADETVKNFGKCGHLILSKYPIESSATVTIVADDGTEETATEGRAMVYAVVDVEGVKIDVFCGENAGGGASDEQRALMESLIKEKVDASGNDFVVFGYHYRGFSEYAGKKVTQYHTGNTILASEGLELTNGKEIAKADIGTGVAGTPNMDPMLNADLTVYVPVVEEEPEDVSLKLMSWGIGRMNGNATYPDQAARWAELLKVIVAENADIIHLHCVNGEAQRDVILADLAAAYPYSIYVQGSANNSQMLLSKYPITSTDTAQISTGENEIRVAGHSIVDVDGTPVEIYFAHLNSADRVNEATAMVTAFGLPTNDAWFVMGAFHGMDISSTMGEAVNSAASGSYTIYAPVDTVTMVGSKNTTCEYGATAGAFHADACILAEVTFAAAEKAPATATLNVALVPAFRFANEYVANAESIHKALVDLGADVLAICQIDKNSDKYNNYDVPGSIAEALKEVYPYSYWIDVWEFGTGTTGHLLLSKYEILETEKIVLNVGEANNTSNEGRAYGRAMLDVNGATVDVFFGWMSNNYWSTFGSIVGASEADAWVVAGHMVYANPEFSGIQNAIGEPISAAFEHYNIDGVPGTYHMCNIISSGNGTFSDAKHEDCTDRFGANADPLYQATITFTFA